MTDRKDPTGADHPHDARSWQSAKGSMPGATSAPAPARSTRRTASGPLIARPSWPATPVGYDETARFARSRHFASW